MVVIVGCIWLSPRRAEADRPSSQRLVGAGVAMAVPMYFAGVAQHELSHAAVAKMFGRRILEIKVLPGFHRGAFYFGYVRYSPRLPTGKRTFFLLAPKLVNVLLLGGYAALQHTDNLPRNRYGQLAFTVWANTQWVDLSKDLLLFWRKHDINVAYKINGKNTFWSKLPGRVVHLALSAAGGYFVVKGYAHVFDRPAPGAAMLLPLTGGAF